MVYSIIMFIVMGLQVLVEALAKLNCHPLCLANIQSLNLMNVELKMFPFGLVPPKAP
jgi:hypothetical protein